MSDINPIGGGHKGQKILVMIELSGDHGRWLAGGAGLVRQALEKVWAADGVSVGPGDTSMQALYIKSEPSGSGEAIAMSMELAKQTYRYTLIPRLPSESALRVVRAAEDYVNNLSGVGRGVGIGELIKAVRKHEDLKRIEHGEAEAEQAKQRYSAKTSGPPYVYVCTAYESLRNLSVCPDPNCGHPIKVHMLDGCKDCAAKGGS